jgi:hypothetical protein
MKITHEDLKEIYRDYLEDKPTASRTKCPSPQIITACLRGESSKKRRNKIINHIFKCICCQEEFELILELVREEKRFIHDLDIIIKEKKHRKEKKLFPFQAFRPAWIYGFILVIGVVLVSIFVQNISEERKYRGAESNFLTLITPNKKVTIEKQHEFKWNQVQNSEYYILEIFDESLYPIWESAQIKENHKVLSKEITEKLLIQKKYYWMVTAFLSDGKTIESRLQDFMISD